MGVGSVVAVSLSNFMRSLKWSYLYFGFNGGVLKYKDFVFDSLGWFPVCGVSVVSSR